MIKIDKLDRKILTQLQRDGRLNNNQLASRVGLSESACLRRVRNLEGAGVIDGYVMILNPAAVGKKVSVFVRITLVGQQQEILETFEQEIALVRDVMECYLMSGDTDYLLRVMVSDHEDYLRIHNRLSQISGVIKIQSSFALKTVVKKTEIDL